MTYSDKVLEETPARATKFLAGIGAVATIRTLLAQAGMTDNDIIEGRDLLFACLAAPRGAAVVVDTDAAKEQRAALAEIDEWDEPNFARFGAALKRHFNDAGQFVFDDLSASTGVASVQGVVTFLARLTELEQGSNPDRQGKKKEDKKAIELLAKRGLDKKERTRLQELTKVALGPTEALPDLPVVQTPEARREALTALRDWYEEWSTTAKAVVKKKGYRIRLGLATRKAPERKAQPAGTEKKPS
ncbi:MAG: hypothetical protein ABI193_19260 [Minicystis sp.]